MGSAWHGGGCGSMAWRVGVSAMTWRVGVAAMHGSGCGSHGMAGGCCQLVGLTRQIVDEREAFNSRLRCAISLALCHEPLSLSPLMPSAGYNICGGGAAVIDMQLIGTRPAYSHCWQSVAPLAHSQSMWSMPPQPNEHGCGLMPSQWPIVCLFCFGQ